MARAQREPFTRGTVAYIATAAMDSGSSRVSIMRVFVVEDEQRGRDVIVREVRDDGTVRQQAGWKVPARELYRTAGAAADAAVDRLRRRFDEAVQAMVAEMTRVSALPIAHPL